MRRKYFGAGVKRKEDFQFLTAHGDFVDGLSLPGMEHLAVLRSIQAHAIILKVDADRARNSKSAVTVLTANNLWSQGQGVPLDSGPDLATRFGCNFATLGHRCMTR